MEGWSWSSLMAEGDMIAEIREKGPSAIDGDGRTFLHHVTDPRTLAAFEESRNLAQVEDDSGVTPIVSALRRGNLDVSKALEDLGAELPTDGSILLSLYRGGNVDAIQWVIHRRPSVTEAVDRAGRTLLKLVALAGDVRTLEVLAPSASQLDECLGDDSLAILALDSEEPEDFMLKLVQIRPSILFLPNKDGKTAADLMPKPLYDRIAAFIVENELSLDQ